MDDPEAGAAPELTAALARAGWPADPAPSDGPLAEVAVLDCSRVLAGPIAAGVLGDLGADVIKVERPGRGDDTRSWGPPFHGDDATYFLAANRNRRGICLDLRDPDGQAICAHLVAHADVVIENFLPDALAALGLVELRARATATWVSLRGATSGGPASDLPGYDAMVQARSGLMGVTGFPQTGPTKVGVALADVIAGLHAATAALAGIAARARGAARGPTVEVGLLEAAVTALVNRASAVLAGHDDPGLLGNEHPSIAPYGPLPCADGSLTIGAGNDAQFGVLCAVLGAGDLAGDQRFATNAARIANRPALLTVLGAHSAGVPVAALRGALESAGVPCAEVNDVAGALDDPHIVAVDLAPLVEHPSGAVRIMGSPLLIDGHRPPIRHAPPTLGQHTGPVLSALGLDSAMIGALSERGAI